MKEILKLNTYIREDIGYEILKNIFACKLYNWYS